MNKLRIIIPIVIFASALAGAALPARESQNQILSLRVNYPSNDIAGKNQYFISKEGTLAVCDFRNEDLILTVYTPNEELSIYILPGSKLQQVKKYENEDLMFEIYGDTAVMKVRNKEEQKLTAADKYSGELPDYNGDPHYTEIFFSDAVNVNYVIRQGDNTKNGFWYLLKGEPLESGSDYNTTLFELLEPDNKTGFKCFMRDINNDKKLILLQGGCSPVKPTEFFLLKED